MVARVSYAEVTKDHVDALVTAAVRWRQTGVTSALGEAMRRELDLTKEGADRVGLALLLQNYYTMAYGEDPDELHDEERAMLDAEAASYDIVQPTSYEFDELPGSPAPETVLALLAGYRYQSEWEGTGLGKVSAFFAALDRAARVQLDGLDAEEIRSLPRHVATPWMLGPDDRDLFIRLG
jgi:hypothetical protein